MQFSLSSFPIDSQLARAERSRRGDASLFLRASAIHAVKND